MIVCGLDLETTGLDPKTDFVTEIGAVLWDTETNNPVLFFNKLLKVPIPISEFIEKLTGINDKLLEKFGEDPNSCWDEFRKFVAPADYLMAHNAPFDRGYIELQCPNWESKFGWIDTQCDVQYPEHIETRKLVWLAAEHGFANPFAHRAVTDVLTMLQIASNYDWNEIIARSKLPNVVLQSKQTFDQNDKAKSVGFRFKKENKTWIKTVKESDVDKEVERCLGLGFNVKRIG